MKGSDPDSRVGHLRLDPLTHFIGRLVGERKRQDLVGRNALREEMSDPAGDHSGLAGARAGQDQEGAINVGNRLILCGRQIGEQFGQRTFPSPLHAAAVSRPLSLAHAAG